MHEGFTTRASDAALLEKRLVAFHFGKKFFGCHFILYRCIRIPRVGVVAEGAPHGAALEEGYETDAGAINRPKRLKTMS